MGMTPTMGPDSTRPTDHELSRLEALPTEILEKQLEQLPVPTLLRVMSVSRRLAAVTSNILRLLFQAVVPGLQNDKVRALLMFAPPALATSAGVLCAYTATEDNGNDITTLCSRFHPEQHPAACVRRPLVCGITLDDGETFTQFKVVVKIILEDEPGGYWVTLATTLFNGTLRLSREWLSKGVSEVKWADEHQTVGLRLRPQFEAMDDLPSGTQYFDLEVQELHIRTTRFLKGVEEEEQAQDDGRLIVLRRVGRNDVN